MIKFRLYNLVSFVICAIFITLFQSPECLAAPSRSSIIDRSLLKTLETKGNANILISFVGGTTLALESAQSKSLDSKSRSERLNMVYHELKNSVAKSQSNVITWLKHKKVGSKTPIKFQTFWISNQLYIQNADLELVQELADTFPEIFDITEEEIIHLDDSYLKTNELKSSDTQSWGIVRIKAKQAWAMENGNRGENIIVANIDTGVFSNHEALNDNFIGSAYGWYDPYDKTEKPNDIHGHGTHTMGLLAGSRGIGVAPGAKWMACRGCFSSLCLVTGLLACGEFMLCPTLQDGTNPDCSRAPHIISNSWGGGRNNLMYHPVINAWVTAGILPVFSNGNNGPTCNTANSPADHPDVIGVGSINNFDQLSEFSSKGPTLNLTLKPDISAPGQSVPSASSKNEKEYVEMTGTSMAAPLAAGASALLLSENPELGISEVKRYLFEGADKSGLPSTGFQCGNIDETHFPNHAYGNGILNVQKSLVNLVQDRTHTS